MLVLVARALRNLGSLRRGTDGGDGSAGPAVLAPQQVEKGCPEASSYHAVDHKVDAETIENNTFISTEKHVLKSVNNCLNTPTFTLA